MNNATRTPEAAAGVPVPLDAVVRWHVHPLDRCQHVFAERGRNVQWTSSGTGGEPPEGAPVCVDEECIICGAGRQRWE